MVLTELHYLPSISWYHQIVDGGKVLIDSTDRYRKQSFRNRCEIRSVNKERELLVIPVRKAEHKLISEVEIDYSQLWVKDHVNAIKSAYGNAPFFEYYWDDFFEVYKSKPRFLFDLNLELFKVTTSIAAIKEMEICHEPEKLAEIELVDVRRSMVEKNNSGKNDIPEYTQVFGKDFVNNLSILDLIFCKGPETAAYLRNF